MCSISHVADPRQNFSAFCVSASLVYVLRENVDGSFCFVLKGWTVSLSRHSPQVSEGRGAHGALTLGTSVLSSGPTRVLKQKSWPVKAVAVFATCNTTKHHVLFFLISTAKEPVDITFAQVKHVLTA